MTGSDRPFARKFVSHPAAAHAVSARRRASLTISLTLPLGRTNALKPDDLHALRDQVLCLFSAPAAADDKVRSPEAAGGADQTESSCDVTGASFAAAAVRAFIDDCCTVNPYVFARAGVLLEAYLTWAAAHDAPKMSPKMFGCALRELGFSRRRSNNIIWCGLELTRPTAPP